MFIRIFISMTRLERCEYLKEKGYTYEPETGKIYGIRGKEIKGKLNGYYCIINKKFPILFHHHLAWYMTYGNLDFDELDHINRNKLDNRICNLRISNRVQQTQNRNSKGYYKNSKANTWFSTIMFEGKKLYLGSFKTEEEARQAYLEAKSKYHII